MLTYLWMRISIFPEVLIFSAASTSFGASEALLTSAWTTMALVPLASISCATFSARSRLFGDT